MMRKMKWISPKITERLTIASRKIEYAKSRPQPNSTSNTQVETGILIINR